MNFIQFYFFSRKSLEVSL